MSDKVDYSNELTEIVVGLKDSLDKCITLITKISGENTNLKESNVTLNTKLDELTQEMANYTKVSFVSNLSKQISEKDYQIVTLKKKLCKLESDHSELVKEKEKEKIKITSNDDILIEVGENNLDKPESNVSHVKKFIDSLNNTLETENNMEERDDIIENGYEQEVDNHESNSEEDQDETDGEVEVEDNESEGEDLESVERKLVEEKEQEDEESDSNEEQEDEESEEEETLDSDKEEPEDHQKKEEEIPDGNEESEDDESDGEEVEFEIVKIKKKKYYLSNEEPKGVYVIEADDDVGDRIGDFIDKKLVKSTS